MRELTVSEMRHVAGGGTTDLGDIVVVGRRRMSDNDIRGILDQWQRAHNVVDHGSAGGGGGGGGGGVSAPPAKVHVWEEDVDGDGRVDTIWIDNDGDGQIGVGDGATFLENGPWSNLNAQQSHDFWAGVLSYLQSWGFDKAKDTAQSAAIGAGTGAAFKIDVKSAAAGATAVGVIHDAILAGFGNINHSESLEIGTGYYADEFGVHNPYTDNPRFGPQPEHTPFQ